MDVKAKAKYIRISPRKARLVADLVRGLDLEEAFAKLAVLNKKAVKSINKLLNSALASAEHNNQLEKSNLFIKDITVNDGPTYYRWMPRAHGRATQLRKRTSIIDITLSEKVESKSMKTTKKEEKIDTVKVDKKVNEPLEEKVELDKKEQLNKEDSIEKEEEKYDIKRKGGHRDMEQKDKGDQKKKSGVFKKMFRRKSGM